MVHVLAQEPVVLPALDPVAATHPAFRLGDAPRRRHHHRPGRVRGGVVEHFRRVGGENTPLAAGGEIDVVVADRDVAHGLETRGGVDDRGVETIGPGGKDAVLVGEPALHLLADQGRIVLLVVLDLEALAQLGDDVFESGARDQNLGFKLPFSIQARSQRPYNTWGSHRPIAGNRYSNTTAITWIPMKGIMPANIWLSVTCGGETPFR